MKTVALAEWKASRKQKRLVRQVLRSGRLTYGDKTRHLEQQFAALHGVNHALFTSSGTSALKIAIHALKDKYKWRDGDEVIIPAVTFVATMNAVIMNNLKPVLVDVDIKTINIDPSLIEKAITSKTRAIIPVHLLGQPADMDSIMQIAEKHNLRVIEDSCETMFVNRVVGDVACFSTYIAHLLVTGVGGFITTNDEQLATTMRSMMFHGRDESYLTIDDQPTDVSKRYWFPRFGYSDRMTELEAALGLGAIDEAQEMISQRQSNAWYMACRLPKELNITIPVTRFSKHAFMFFPLLVERRNELMLYLEAHGIQTRTMLPLTNQPIAKAYTRKKYPVAQYINDHGLLIGCHQALKKSDMDYVTQRIREFYQ